MVALFLLRQVENAHRHNEHQNKVSEAHKTLYNAKKEHPHRIRQHTHAFVDDKITASFDGNFIAMATRWPDRSWKTDNEQYLFRFFTQLCMPNSEETDSLKFSFPQKIYIDWCLLSLHKRENVYSFTYSQKNCRFTSLANQAMASLDCSSSAIKKKHLSRRVDFKTLAWQK